MIWYHHIHNMNSCWASLFLPTETVIEGKERCSHLILEIETCIWDQPTPPSSWQRPPQPLQCPPNSGHPETGLQVLSSGWRFHDHLHSHLIHLWSSISETHRVTLSDFQQKRNAEHIRFSFSSILSEEVFQGSALKALTNLSVKAGDQQKLEFTRNLRNPRFIHTPYSWVGNKTTKKTSNQNNKKTNKSPKQTKKTLHTQRKEKQNKKKTKLGFS